MDTNTLKPALLLMITALGASIPAPDFVGSVVLAGFSAILAAVWSHEQGTSDRAMTVAAGILAGLVIVIGHEEFLPDLAVQIKAVLAGLTGRYLLSFVMRSAKELSMHTREFAKWVLRRLGVSDNDQS